MGHDDRSLAQHKRQIVYRIPDLEPGDGCLGSEACASGPAPAAAWLRGLWDVMA